MFNDEQGFKDADELKLHEILCKQLHTTYKAKNKDYGSSHLDTYKQFGMVSYLVRMEDKMNRLISLTNNSSREIKDESMLDTLLDLANYCLLASTSLIKYPELAKGKNLKDVENTKTVLEQIKKLLTTFSGDMDITSLQNLYTSMIELTMPNQNEEKDIFHK